MSYNKNFIIKCKHHLLFEKSNRYVFLEVPINLTNNSLNGRGQKKPLINEKQLRQNGHKVSQTHNILIARNFLIPEPPSLD